jgi:hypothetical protein
MKRIITILLLIGFFFSFIQLEATENIQKNKKSERIEKRELKRMKEDPKAGEQGSKASNELQSNNDQTKKEIEIKEHTANKNKKVKRFSTDDKLPQTIRKRNIP